MRELGNISRRNREFYRLSGKVPLPTVEDRIREPLPETRRKKGGVRK